MIPPGLILDFDRDDGDDHDVKAGDYDEVKFGFLGLSCRTVPPWHTW